MRQYCASLHAALLAWLGQYLAFMHKIIESHVSSMISGLKDSTALSQAAITAGALLSVTFNVSKVHPADATACLIDFDLALMLTPIILVGVTIGEHMYVCSACESAAQCQGTPHSPISSLAFQVELLCCIRRAWRASVIIRFCVRFGLTLPRCPAEPTADGLAHFDHPAVPPGAAGITSCP